MADDLGTDRRREWLADRLGHVFADPDLMNQGCTHSSHVNANQSALERVRTTNERMEFLGDAVLGTAVAEILYRAYPDAKEGLLSRAKSQLVSRPVLARCMERLDLLPCCLVGDTMTVPWPDSVKANLAEGILGAIYLDGSWTAVSQAIVLLLGERLRLDHVDLDTDAKTRLQQLCLERYAVLPTYASERTGGSDHEPVFTCRVSIDELSATALGGSRQSSEASAAQTLLDHMGESS